MYGAWPNEAKDTHSLHQFFEGLEIRRKSLIQLVGAEGFEVLFPSDHYAVFFVEFNGKTPGNQGLAKILRHALSFPIFLRLDAIPQEFGITGIIPRFKRIHKL
jgi:hypothetical protein